MAYEATGNEDIVREISEETIDLSVLVNEYIRLRTEFLNRPQPKTVPDQETLDFWNQDIEGQNEVLMAQATALYNEIKPIYEAGLLPSKYEDEYQQLELFVNG